MAYDLMLFSRANSARSRSDAEALFRALSSIAVIAEYCEITPGAAGPTAIDPVCLDDAIASGDFSIDEFIAFCGERGLVANPQEEHSAAAFLDSEWGALLVSVKMPHTVTQTKAVYGALVQFANSHDLRLFDPQSGCDIDLATARELPPGW
jgi:hypothetical protein